ncbi:MAG: CDP-glycerol glycerophosphotransferase family protein [Clostridia bacterium]|nr:CDP-glycerol glycerophosphotransferase family protein [Clostridia bacterium]
MILMYIDPGTGSMLVTVIIGILGAALYSVKMLWMKLRMKMGSGKVAVEKKRTPFVIFSDNKRYWSVFEPICREMSKRGKEVVYLTASEDDPVFGCDYAGLSPKFIGSGNKMYAKLNYLNATVVLSTTPGLDVYQWKRSPSAGYYVHILHAASEVVLYRMFGIDYYDAVLLSGEYQREDIRKLEKLRALPEKELPIIGIPYMDKMAKRLEEAPPLPPHERTVLLAPSWGKSAIFSVYGGKILDLLLKTGYRIIVRPHPQSFLSEGDLMAELMAKYPASDRLEWNRDVDNFEVLRRSDLLISDFSGVIFDFSLVYGKPIIYTDPNFDTAPYDAWWLKDPLWTVSALPRLGKKLTEENFAELGRLIEECLESPEFERGIAEVKGETWQHPGEGAVRAVDYLLAKYDELTKDEVE